MSKATSVLFGIEDEFDVIGVDRTGPGQVKVIIAMRDREAPCPTCGVLTTRVKQRPVRRVTDLPASGQRVELWWHQRRLVCTEILCERGSFTQTSDAIRPRARVTQRLRDQLADSIAGSNRAVSGVAGEYGVSWPTAHRALIVAATRLLPAPELTSRLGIDETRARSVRWITSDAGWVRSDPWMTSFVDCSTDCTSGVSGSGSLLGLVPGRSGGCVRDWLNAQTPEFRAGIGLVVIDPSAPYASGIRAALPHVRIAVDKWHLVALANQMVTEVRQRVTRTRLGRRGTTADRVWNNRLLLLTGADHLSDRQWDRLMAGFDTTDSTADPTGELGAAWGVKERLRLLLGEREPSKIRWRLADFYDAVIDADMAETSRLATTIQTWWPAVLVALTEQVSNARTEGFNRIIKQVKRVGCGYRNMTNYRRRILTHIAVTRPCRSAA